VTDGDRVIEHSGTASVAQEGSDAAGNASLLASEDSDSTIGIAFFGGGGLVWSYQEQSTIVA
jgi:hypothetical protein